jgi:hypothetical protein
VPKNTVYIFLFFLLSKIGISQTATIYGTVKDAYGEPVPDVQIAVLEDGSNITTTDNNGNYFLAIPAGKEITVTIYSMGYKQFNKKINAIINEKINLSAIINAKEFKPIEIVSENREVESIHLDPKIFINIPNPGGGIEGLLKTQIGVSSNNELSSGYSVRGGNFDENLVYVNDIEVYRPFLARSGQQEGLSFANPEMVSNINFSPGGFEAKYGDKLSSALDITYKKPLKFNGSASGSFLGGALNLEGVSKNRIVAWSIGSRYRTNSYLLRTLDVKGDYRPQFYDVQTFITFTLDEKWTIEFLGNIANNKYTVSPTDRETTFGTVNDAVQLKILLDGKEETSYNTFMAGVSSTYRPNSKTKLKFITSAYNAQEEEKFTSLGQYEINQLEVDFSKDNFGKVAFKRGSGSFLNYGRNEINATVINIEHKGTRYLSKNNELLWGLRFQHEIINDKLSEWNTVDSAGYVRPYNKNEINLSDVVKTKLNIESNRTQGYIQYSKHILLHDSSKLTFTGGLRANFWDFNGQTVTSPRLTFAYKPNWKKDFLFKLSWGYYYQPPFYREMRGFDGKLNQQIKAQQSIHYLLSSDYNLNIWNRPFKIIVAGYYKDLKNLIPYEIDNTRLRYFAKNNSVGYATGLDVRINGEFVKGTESWATIGFLKTMENIIDDRVVTYYNAKGDTIKPGITFDTKATDSSVVNPGYIPRPTDQRITFGMFFQDYLPKLPNCKMYVNFQFGTGLPFGPPDHVRWKQIFRMPPYRRVDVGFAYQIIKEGDVLPKKNPFRHLKGLFISVEIFNLLQINNTVSYTWVTDVTNRQYAVPNYLTGRQINLKFQVKF